MDDVSLIADQPFQVLVPIVHSTSIPHQLATPPRARADTMSMYCPATSTSSMMQPPAASRHASIP
ncbi:hypothetical protein CALVIDRAFT_540434 [Calocera viscosa TUFC12733]|uniref:Uncharacterized protein n=1 Tax=Calocera viscosa (strain TUFC12733) TaxID=1330018 RepID=A0A167IUF3_CALVF|nr:hypothetical protein CALVIDRAFT_540434 [Calocera viscosa TUFC12733]